MSSSTTPVGTSTTTRSIDWSSQRHGLNGAVAALDGVNLVGLDADKARELLVRHGGNSKDVLGEGDVYDVSSGVGFTGDPIESVWVFPPNYYVERAVPGFGSEDR